MRKIDFGSNLRDYLTNLRDELGPISLNKMSKANCLGGGGTGCGEQCKVTCAYWCSPVGPGQTADRPDNSIPTS